LGLIYPGNQHRTLHYYHSVTVTTGIAYHGSMYLGRFDGIVLLVRGHQHCPGADGSEPHGTDHDASGGLPSFSLTDAFLIVIVVGHGLFAKGEDDASLPCPGASAAVRLHEASGLFLAFLPRSLDAV
jgi:hypothetical protein